MEVLQKRLFRPYNILKLFHQIVMHASTSSQCGVYLREMHNLDCWRYTPVSKKVLYAGLHWMTDDVKHFKYVSACQGLIDLDNRNVY